MDSNYDTSGMERFVDNNAENTSQAVATACPEEVPLPEALPEDNQILEEQNHADYGLGFRPDESGGSNSIEHGAVMEPLYLQAPDETADVVTDAEGVQPKLLYDKEEFRELIVTGENGSKLQIVFDYPQNFVYSCGRKGDKLYLLVARREASGGYEHQLLLFDFEERRVDTEAVLQRETALVKWISLQDKNLSYECEN